MYDFTIKRNGIEINLKSFLVGNDLCVIIYGGDRPHIGAVTLSTPGMIVSNSNKLSVSTSILTLTGHKDDEAARLASTMLASRLNKNIVVICGIHVDDITDPEISTVMIIIKEMTNMLIEKIIKNNSPS